MSSSVNEAGSGDLLTDGPERKDGLGRDAGFLTASNLVQLPVSVALGAITARVLGPSGRGDLYLVLQIGVVGGIVFAMGLGASYQYHLGSSTASRRGVVTHALFQMGFAAIVLGVIAGSAPLWFARLFGAGLSPSLFVASLVLVLLNMASLCYGGILTALPGGVARWSILSGIGSISTLILLVLATSLFRMGTMGAIVAYGAGLTIKALPAAVTAMRASASLSTGEARLYARSVYVYGANSFLANLMLTSVFRIDVFIIRPILGAAELGIYSVAVALAELVLLVPSALGSALFIRIPSTEKRIAEAMVEQSTRVTIVLAGMIGACLALLSPLLVWVIAGQRYARAAVPLAVLVPGLVAMATIYVFSNHFMARGRPWVCTRSFAVGLLANLALNLFIIRQWGIIGAAFASSVAYTLIAVLFLFELKRDGFDLRLLLLPQRSDYVAVRARIFRLFGRGAGTVSPAKI